MATKCKKTYKNGEGEISSHASADVISLSFAFTDGPTSEIVLSDLSADVLKAAAAHGLSQKLGDSYAGKDGDEAVEAFGTVLEQLKGGEWIKVGEGVGTRPSMVADAIKAALEASGETVDEDRYKLIVEKVKGNDARKAALANAAISAQYERIKAERAVERASKAEEKASGVEADLSGF